MKLTFDSKRLFNEYVSKYTDRLDKSLEETKEYIDSKTPELTGELIEHNKIKRATLSGMLLAGSVFNDLGEYEFDVEEGKGTIYQYHKYPPGVSLNLSNRKRRTVIKAGNGAFMFRDGFTQAKNDILLELLR